MKNNWFEELEEKNKEYNKLNECSCICGCKEKIQGDRHGICFDCASCS